MADGTDTAASRTAFELLAPELQEELYRMRWTELRAIQVDAIKHIIAGKGNLIISAATAAGKTEAAFLPILSQIIGDRCGGVAALYVGPLRALINDQFRRLAELCERAEIPVHKWHGEVGAPQKRELLDRPAGVLLITPESIESLFINHPSHLSSIFGRLRFIVVDEVHSFIGAERGAHLKSLLTRVTRKSQGSVRLVGLSATLGDVSLACRWLCPREAESMRVVQDDSERTIRYRLQGYLRASLLREAPGAEVDEPEETEADLRLARDVISTFLGRTALIFVNSRKMVEFYADLVRRLVARQGLPDRFRVHHGSLAKAEREEAEEALRSEAPTATFCSSTLELGIDVGNISAVGQIGAPWSVSSLTQRLGRSGRKEGEPCTMRVFLQQDRPGAQTMLVDRLFPELLQAIAMTELMLEKWCEPPEVNRLHLSTLVQQIMSVIAERGAATASELHEALVASGAFANVDSPSFAEVLRSMGAADLIEQTPQGELILGLEGERIVRSFDFYAAFATAQEMRVVHEGRAIGSVTATPGLAADGYLILAGRRWKVLEIDVGRQEISVEPSRGGRLPHFAGASGADIHPVVRQKMREVVLGDVVPQYLDSTAKAMLAAARTAAREADLAEVRFLCDGSSTIWFTWTGSRINRTVLALGSGCAGSEATDDDIALTFANTSKHALVADYRDILSHPPTALSLAAEFSLKSQEKYDRFLSSDLQARVFAQNALDIDGALSAIREMVRSEQERDEAALGCDAGGQSPSAPANARGERE